MKKPLVTASQIGKGQNRYSMNAAVICENESLRSETLKVAGDNQRGATDQAMQVVQDDLPEADPRLDYRVVITEVERLEDENTKDEAAG